MSQTQKLYKTMKPTKLLSKLYISILGIITYFICSSVVIQAKPLQVGVLSIRPHIDQTANYNDNIFISNTNRVSAWSFNTQPGVQISVGQTEALKLSMDYTASIVNFVDQQSQDNWGNNLTFTQASVFNRFTISSFLNYNFSTGANTLVGEYIPSGNLNSGITSIWRLSEKFTLSTYFNHQFNNFTSFGLVDNAQNVIGASLGYSFDELTTFNLFGNWSNNTVSQGQDINGYNVGVGINRVFNTTYSGFFNVGYAVNAINNVFQGNQTFETANVTTGQQGGTLSRVAPSNDSRGGTIGAGISANTGKLTSTASGTAFIGDSKDSIGGGSQSFSFTCGANFSYAITTKTTASLNVYRSINQSITEVNNMYYNTGTNLTLSQKITQKLTASAFFNWNNVDFQNPVNYVGIGNVARNDNNYTAGVNLTYLLQEWLRIYGGYQYNVNESNVSNFSFTQNQVTIGIGASF